MKVLRRKQNNSRINIIELKHRDGYVTSNRSEIITIVEEFNKELYTNKERELNTPTEIKKESDISTNALKTCQKSL